jgi:uncharacterized protein involved in exopolysaccharide biosynthesis
MTEKPEHNDLYSEMDFGHILRALYRQKWVVLGVTLIAAAAASLYSMTLPNVYESTAALIVRDPLQALEQNPEEATISNDNPTLSVESLQTLTESTEIHWMLFESLWSKKLIPTWTEEANKLAYFQGLQDKLSTELKRQQGRKTSNAVELLPILVLKARATTPEMAQVIANEWAQIVEQKSREVYMMGVETSGAFIGEMFEKSNTTLRGLEEELAKTTLAADVTLNEARLKTLAEKISLLEGEILDIDLEIAMNEVTIAEGRRRTEGLEVGGDWIGTVAEDLLLRKQAYPFDPAALSEQARTVIAAVERKVAQKDSTRDYRQEQNILAKEKEFAHLQLDIERILLEKATVDDKLPALEGALASLNAKIEAMPDRIVLSKSITDDALWNSFLGDAGGGEKAAVPLKSENLNPVHQAALESATELSTEIETLRGSATQLKASAERVMETMRALEEEVDLSTQEIGRRTIAVEATEGSLKLLLEDYLKEKNGVDALLVMNMRNKEEREIRVAKRIEFENQVRAVEKEVSDATLEIEQLTREVTTTKNVRTALASRAEAATLLQVSADNASRTGTAILFKAELNPGKVGPARTNFVLSSMLGAMLVCCVCVCIAMLLREAE